MTCHASHASHEYLGVLKIYVKLKIFYGQPCAGDPCRTKTSYFFTYLNFDNIIHGLFLWFMCMIIIIICYDIFVYGMSIVDMSIEIRSGSPAPGTGALEPLRE